MMKSWLIVSALLLPALAHADLTGKYSGTGSSLFHKSGHQRPCSEIFVKLEQSATEVRVLEGGYVCEDLQASVDAYTLKIQNGGLISQEGFDVGTLEGDTLDLNYTDKQENFTYSWRIEKTAQGTLKYLEHWDDAGKPALTVEGELSARK